MSEPAYLRLARSFIGTHEGVGARDNPVVVQMYADVKQSGIKHDSVPWCAAFVGAMLERSGIRSTRSLRGQKLFDIRQRR